MINYRQSIQSPNFTAPNPGVVSGAPVLIGSLLVVPSVDADEGDSFAAETTGIFELSKTTGEAWTEGQKIYWNAGTSKVSTTSGGNTLVGTASAVAGSADTTGLVRLDGVAR